MEPTSHKSICSQNARSLALIAEARAWQIAEREARLNFVMTKDREWERLAEEYRENAHRLRERAAALGRVADALEEHLRTASAAQS